MKKLTQKQKVLNYLKENENITSLDSFSKLWIMDLQGVIRDLKKDGYTIMDRWVSKTNMYGEKKKFKLYFLIQNKEDIIDFLHN